MTYRYPYMYGGELCDYDPDFMKACELKRLVEEADGAAIPTIDMTEEQAYLE